MIKENFLNLIKNYSKDENYNTECWIEIKNKYSENSRHYHNLEHLENMIAELEPIYSQISNLDTLLFAIYYHDIVYKATKNDNEHQSALLFQQRLTKVSFPYLKACSAQIEATKEHKLSLDNDTNILLDIDLSILGKRPKVYLKYCENIRKEYHVYPDFMYRKGRKKVLKHILELDSIYKTAFFKEKYESQARNNITTELKLLL